MPAEPTVATTASPTEQELSVSAAAVAPPSAQASPSSSSSGSSSVDNLASASNVRQEFGP